MQNPIVKKIVSTKSYVGHAVRKIDKNTTENVTFQ